MGSRAIRVLRISSTLSFTEPRYGAIRFPLSGRLTPEKTLNITFAFVGPFSLCGGYARAAIFIKDEDGVIGSLEWWFDNRGCCPLR